MLPDTVVRLKGLESTVVFLSELDHLSIKSEMEVLHPRGNVPRKIPSLPSSTLYPHVTLDKGLDDVKLQR